MEIEYVGIEDVQEIMDDAFGIMQGEHYVNVEVSNIMNVPDVKVYVMLGGWVAKKGYDYSFNFNMTDKPEDVKAMNDCKYTLKNLLAEE